MASSPSAVLVVLLMMLTPLSACIASSPEQGLDVKGADAFDGGRFSPMSEWSYNFSV